MLREIPLAPSLIRFLKKYCVTFIFRFFGNLNTEPSKDVLNMFAVDNKFKLDFLHLKSNLSECIPRSSCPPPKIPKMALKPGEKLLNVTEGACCPRVKIQCNPKTCPEIKTCPKHYNRVRKDDGSTCCPMFECGKQNFIRLE